MKLEFMPMIFRIVGLVVMALNIASANGQTELGRGRQTATGQKPPLQDYI